MNVNRFKDCDQSARSKLLVKSGSWKTIIQFHFSFLFSFYRRILVIQWNCYHTWAHLTVQMPIVTIRTIYYRCLTPRHTPSAVQVMFYFMYGYHPFKAAWQKEEQSRIPQYHCPLTRWKRRALVRTVREVPGVYYRQAGSTSHAAETMAKEWRRSVILYQLISMINPHAEDDLKTYPGLERFACVPRVFLGGNAKNQVENCTGPAMTVPFSISSFLRCFICPFAAHIACSSPWQQHKRSTSRSRSFAVQGHTIKHMQLLPGNPSLRNCWSLGPWWCQCLWLYNVTENVIRHWHFIWVIHIFFWLCG